MSLGLTQEQYWEMTQYEIELVQEANNRKWEREKRVELFTINTIMRMFAKNAKAISWTNMLGIFKKKLKQPFEFENVEAYFEYLKQEGVRNIDEYRANCSRDNSDNDRT